MIIKSYIKTKKYNFLNLFIILVILALFIGLLPFPSYAEQTDNSAGQAADLADNGRWQKTLDRHQLLSVAHGNNVYTAAGGDGVIKSSTDGENWFVAHSTGVILNSVIWGKDKFVAVGNLGQILISADGLKWDAVNSGTEKALTGVAWNGSNFAAVGDRGTLLVSDDGIDWSKRPLETEYSFSGIISGSGKYIATINDTFNTILTSNDGKEWKTVEPVADLYGYNNPAYNGETFIMNAKIPHQGGSLMIASKDGENWTKVENAPKVTSVTSDGTGFVALGDTFRDENNILTQNIYTSDDGKKWEPNSVKWDSGYYSDLRTIKYCNDELIGLNLLGEIFSSEDGLQWTRENTGLDDFYNKIAWDGGQFVAYDDAGNMAVSKDGATWTESTVKLNLEQPIRGINYLDNNIIVVFAGTPAKMYASKDGANWTLQEIEGLNGLENGKVISVGDKYVLTAGDAVYISSDAEEWEKLSIPAAELTTNSIAYNGTTYISVGGRGRIVGGEGNSSDPYRIIGTSIDLKEWKTEKTENASALSAVVWADSRFVAVGDDGMILTSKDGLNGWTQVKSPTTNDLLSIIWDGAGYIATGEYGTILYSEDGSNWTKEKGITSDSISKVIVQGDQYLALGSGTILKGTIIPEAKPIKFEDIENHWAEAVISQMAERKIIAGVDEKNFAPDHDITRAEFAAIIVRALGLKYSGEETQLTDVQTSDWYYETVSAAYEHGILKGYGEGMIKPGQNITREEAMAMMARALNLNSVNIEITEAEIIEALKVFKDRDSISSWAAETAAICVRSQLFEGNDGYLEPRDNITRAETAAIVFRMLEQYK